MSSRVKKMFFSQFMFWAMVVVAGSYFLFSVDWKMLSVGVDGKKTTFLERVYKAIKVPRMNLGIDLQGGAHLVVSVEIEKAIENRLIGEGKVVDEALKRKKFALPNKKEVKDQSFIMTFDSESAASSAYKMVKKEFAYLKVTRKGVVVNVELSAQDAQRIRTQSIEQAVSVLKRRLDIAGVQGLVVQQHGERQIVIQLPGETDVDEKKELISKTAHLEFKLVEKVASSRDALLDKYDGELPPDKEIVQGRERHEKRYYLVSTFADVTGDHIVFAKEDFDEYGKLQVLFTLDSSGARDFAELTENNIGRQVGIIIDDVMYSAPVINTPIKGGRGVILGDYTSEEARALSIVLNSGALKAPLKFEYETRVGASLGNDSIKKGLLSCLIGLLLLFVFGVLYYRLAGLFAFLALVFNLFLVLFFLSWFRFALTLPGIAGLVLTIGMAIDASILIYERIREELSGGTSIRKAVQDGFKGAMVVIFDSNITTFLTGLVLFKFGGPSIRGFAVTLMAGIVATIIASIFFLRSLFLFSIDAIGLKKFGLK